MPVSSPSEDHPRHFSSRNREQGVATDRRFGDMIETREALNLLETKVVSWLKALVQMLPNLLVAALIVVVAWLAAKLVRNMAMRLVRRVVKHETLRSLISTTVFLTIVLVGVFAALSILHLDKAVTTVLAGAGIVGLAIGFAFQDIAANFISGVLMAINKPIRVGELIGTADLMMQHRAVKAIKAAYDRNGITIPFPIRTLDFGIKGGEKLDSMIGRNGGTERRSTNGPGGKEGHS